ncbi:MAG: protein phosphatase 2C domain-containing protein [Lachnospiraceae bacterium]|nr:protein phosphatase 2C domain-containing protein [Lachnospiraceae bacterium]
MLQIRHYGITEKNGREKNEDAYGVFDFTINKKNFFVAAVCDGMGAKEESQQVSRECVEGVCARLVQKVCTLPENYLEGSAQWLEWWFDLLRKQIQLTEQYLIEKYFPKAIGTTIALILIYDRKWMFLADCGDSPCYVVDTHRQRIEKYSRVRNLAEENLMRDPCYYEEDGRRSWLLRDRCCLSAGIGFQSVSETPLEKIHVDFMGVQSGMLIALGSDGAFSTLCEEDILFSLSDVEREKNHEIGTLEEKALDLLGYVKNFKQERDNQTLVLIQIEETEESV